MDRPQRARVVCLILLHTMLASGLAGCHKWSGPGTPADVLAEDELPSRIRVRLTDDRQYELEHPTLQRDTLRGWAETQQDTVRIPVSDVRGVEVRKTNWCTTGLLIYLAAGTVGFVLCTANNDCYE